MSAVMHAIPHTPPAVDHLPVPGAALQAWPLADELLVSGSPEASGCMLSASPDGRVTRGIWACTPGVFRWDWTCDETVVVISGRESVLTGDGRQVELRPGDMAFFEAGVTSVWTIHEPFRKAFHTLAAPAPV